MYFGDRQKPVLDDMTGRPKLTVLSNWWKPPLQKWTLLFVGLFVGLALSVLLGLL